MWRHVTGLGLPGYARLAFWNWNVTPEISGPLGDERGFSWNSPGLHTAPRNAPDLGVSQVRIVVLRPCLRAGWLWPSVRCLLPLTPAQALIVAALGRPSPQRRRGPRYFPHAPSMARMTATGPGLPLPRAGCGILAPNHMMRVGEVVNVVEYCIIRLARNSSRSRCVPFPVGRFRATRIGGRRL